VAGAVAAYRAHGWARLADVASPSTVDALRQRVDDLQRGRLTIPGLFFQPDTPAGRYEDLDFSPGWVGPEREYRKIEKLELDPLFLAWLNNPLFERIARAVIPGDVAIYRAAIFAKAANGGTDLPWHQDGGQFWGLDRHPVLQLWTALDDAPVDAGCLEVLPQSHLSGLATPHGGIVPRANLAGADADARKVAVPAHAGDVVLLHNHVRHRSGPNATASPRRGFTVCYMSADTRCTRKKRAPRTFLRVFEGPR
jgi:hypothetical protein